MKILPPVVVAVVAPCERAIALQTADEWVYPTLLVAAFHAGDVPKAQELPEKGPDRPRSLEPQFRWSW